MMYSHSPLATVTGGGGRDLLPPETTGFGGGGRGDGDEVYDMQQQWQHYRLGLLIMIASAAMLFISITTLLAVQRGGGRYDGVSGIKHDWSSVLLPMKLLLANSVALGLSCLLAEVARRKARMESVLAVLTSIPGIRRERAKSQYWAWATVAASTLFLVGQVFVWRKIAPTGVAARGVANAYFYLMTGAHALQLLAGMGVLLYASLAQRTRRSAQQRYITLDITAWYWHFLAASWVYVLGVLYFIG